MEPSPSTPHATLRLSDLQTLARISTLRLPLREAESRRAARVRAVLAAGSDLSRQLAAHTHCLLVNCQGTHGTGDLERETAALHAAAARYVALVGELVRDYGRFLEVAAPRLDADASAGLLAHALLTEPALASGGVMGAAFGPPPGASPGASPGTLRRVS